jgi:hypothetical protein
MRKVDLKLPVRKLEIVGYRCYGKNCFEGAVGTLMNNLTTSLLIFFMLLAKIWVVMMLQQELNI